MSRWRQPPDCESKRIAPRHERQMQCSPNAVIRRRSGADAGGGQVPVAGATGWFLTAPAGAEGAVPKMRPGGPEVGGDPNGVNLTRLSNAALCRAETYITQDPGRRRACPGLLDEVPLGLISQRHSLLTLRAAARAGRPHSGPRRWRGRRPNHPPPRQSRPGSAAAG